MEWQPIETAPKNFSRFLGYWPSPEPDRHAPCEIRTWWSGHRWENPYESSETTAPPTHWMPLPEPPKEEV